MVSAGGAASQQWGVSAAGVDGRADRACKEIVRGKRETKR